MVRLVFRPYTQIWRSICTSVPLRASTRVSSGFTLFRHSSPSFGSQQIRSYSNPSACSFRVGRWCTPQGGSHLHSLSLRSRVCHPNTRVCVRLLGPCFKTGHLRPFRQHPKHSSRVSWHEPKATSKEEASPLLTGISSPYPAPPKRAAVLNPAHCIRASYNTPPESRVTFLRSYPASQIDVDLTPGTTHTSKPACWTPTINTDLKRFPFNNFTCYLTLFSKCFSSFLHSTCSLSVSCQYLALDEIYHPFWAAFPNNSTLWRCITKQRCWPRPKTGFSPSLMSHSRETWTRAVAENTSSNYNAESKTFSF